MPNTTILTILLSVLLLPTVTFAAKRPSWCQEVLVNSSDVLAPDTAVAISAEVPLVERWLFDLGFEELGYPPQLAHDRLFRNYLGQSHLDWSKLNDVERRGLVTQYFAQRWDRWTALNPAVRSTRMVLELETLGWRTPSDQPVPLNGQDILERVAGKNTQRMLDVIAHKTPARPDWTEAQRETVEAFADNLNFALVHIRRTTSDETVDTPLISERDLEDAGALALPSFYRKLTEDAPSVIFRLIPVRSAEDKPYVTPVPKQTVLHFPLKMAELGFALPNIEDPHDLFTLGRNYFPAEVEQLLGTLNFRLSEDQRGIDKLMRMMRYDFNGLFPDDRVSHQLRSLRYKLIDMVYTPEQAVTILRHAVKAYLADLSLTAHYKFERALSTLDTPSDLSQLVAESCSWLGIPTGLTIHIPGSLSSRQLRSQTVGFYDPKTSPIYSNFNPKPWLPPTDRMDPEKR